MTFKIHCPNERPKPPEKADLVRPEPVAKADHPCSPAMAGQGILAKANKNINEPNG